MLYNKNNLAVASCAAKSELRPELSSVLFLKDRTVATDAYKLIEVTAPTNFNEQDFPKIEGSDPVTEYQPFLIPAKDLKNIKLPKNKNFPILETCAVKTVLPTRVELMTTDLQTVDIKTFRLTDGKFPEYEKIFPVESPVIDMVFDAKLIIDILDVLKDLNPGNNRVRIKLFANNDKPLVIESENSNQKGRALVMPILQ